jgi:hypothetical protein
LVIKVTTRSGLGVTKPTGTVSSSYGSFGSVTSGFRLAYGGQKWGNFIAANGLNTSRFLDPPELHAIHDKGNEENLFDRTDFNVTGADSIHTNFQYTRSWFQTPNTMDNLNVGVSDPVTGQLLPAADQRALIKTFNVAPVWTRLISTTTLFTLGAFVRHDQFNYFPSGNVFADGTGLIPKRFAGDLEPESQTDQRGPANRHVLREGSKQHQGRRHFSTYLPDGEIQLRDYRSKFPSFADGRKRQPLLQLSHQSADRLALHRTISVRSDPWRSTLSPFMGTRT